MSPSMQSSESAIKSAMHWLAVKPEAQLFIEVSEGLGNQNITWVTHPKFKVLRSMMHAAERASGVLLAGMCLRSDVMASHLIAETSMKCIICWTYIHTYMYIHVHYHLCMVAFFHAYNFYIVKLLKVHNNIMHYIIIGII